MLHEERAMCVNNRSDLSSLSTDIVNNRKNTVGLVLIGIAIQMQTHIGAQKHKFT
jgi:hypothetical protein